MPVVHSSASVLRTDGVLTGHGPSSKVSTTSLSRRKSSCLKCSKPKPGPPVVSISTVRDTPSASGTSHFDADLFAPAAAPAAGARLGVKPGAVARAGAPPGTRAGAGATSGGAEPVVDC